MRMEIDNEQMGGTHWTCCYMEDIESLYFDLVGWPPDNFYFIFLPKAITFCSYNTQVMYTCLCGTYSLYFFHLIERMDAYNTVLKKKLCWNECQ